jgi:hypothetical protein
MLWFACGAYVVGGDTCIVTHPFPRGTNTPIFRSTTGWIDFSRAHHNNMQITVG